MTFFAAMLAATWLGILTSISPCPLTTNTAAMSFIGRRVDRPGIAVSLGLGYTLGRGLAYVALAALLSFTLLSAAGLSHVLQKYLNKLLGPILVVAGMFLLDLLRFAPTGWSPGREFQRRIEALGWIGSVALGAILALSFCPVSAALFFGSLVPLSLRAGSWLAVPLAYSVGTALPVVLFAVLLAIAGNRVGAAFDRLTRAAAVLRMLTGVVFIGVGVYLALVHIYGIHT